MTNRCAYCNGVHQSLTSCPNCGAPTTTTDSTHEGNRFAYWMPITRDAMDDMESNYFAILNADRERPMWDISAGSMN